MHWRWSRKKKKKRGAGRQARRTAREPLASHAAFDYSVADLRGMLRSRMIHKWRGQRQVRNQKEEGRQTNEEEHSEKDMRGEEKEGCSKGLLPPIMAK